MSTPDITPDILPDDWTYRPLQDGLRAVGHSLDLTGRRLASLLVVLEGFIVTLNSTNIREPDDAVLLTHEEMQSLTAVCRAQRGQGNAPNIIDPFFPTGYEDFLRALGDAAARQQWVGLRLVRIGEDAIVRHGTQVGRKEVILRARDVEAILNRAFQQRGHGPMS
jgi:hypothetical protein